MAAHFNRALEVVSCSWGAGTRKFVKELDGFFGSWSTQVSVSPGCPSRIELFTSFLNEFQVALGYVVL